MLRPRIIPCLLIHNDGLVKTVGFENSRYVGDPINAIKVFNEKLVDEIMVVDIDATVNKTEPNYKLIESFSAEARMPVSYVGGIKSVDQIRKIISLGVEKVGMSSAALENPDLITQAAEEVGSQSIVVVLDVKKINSNTYQVFTHNGKNPVDDDPIDLAIQAVSKGAGELIVYSIDRDGTNMGYDYQLIDSIRNSINVPITAIGGAGSIDDLKELIDRYQIIGAGAGDMFVFKGKFKAVLITYPTKEAKDFICGRS